MEATLNLQVKPDWDEIDGVRTQSVSFLRGHGLPEEAVDALAMVTSELTENAVKYGRFDGPVHEIGVTLSHSGDAVTVEVRSPVRGDDTAGTLAKLDHTIQWIRGYQDPFQAYVVRLREVSSESVDTPTSGLGLVRIAYEGNAVLDFYVDEQDMLAISAVYTLDSSPSSSPEGAQ